MSESSRPQKRSDDPTPLIGEKGKSGESHPSSGGAPRAEPEPSDPVNPQCVSGEGEQPRGGITMPNSLLGYQSRSPVFRALSRSSSGYFSFDCESLPSSPLMRHNKSTQTPSPSSQVVTHALQSLAQAQDTWGDHDVWPGPACPYRPHPQPIAGDMRQEVLIGQELQRIGDEFNNLFMHGHLAGRNGQVAQLNQQHQEPALLLWIGLLIGRILQLILRRR